VLSSVVLIAPDEPAPPARAMPTGRAELQEAGAQADVVEATASPTGPIGVGSTYHYTTEVEVPL
jgi:hypothetical protein